jgi:hypothetical protein
VSGGGARLICVGTHHKTGTLWMRKVFRDIARDQDIPFMQFYRMERMVDVADTGPHILVNWSSSFPPPLLDHPDARFIHMIRDPRDVLLSGMRFHRIAPLLNEKFLREERREWGGKNYQDYLNSLPNEHEQLLFEMAHKHDKTVREMVKWPADHPGAITLKYEDMIDDPDCTLFRKVLGTFAFDGIDIDRAVQSYWDKSLFGGLAKTSDRTERESLHVTSGTKAQWVTKMPREIAEIYADQYGEALRVLGYADNSDWVHQCRPAKDMTP